MNLPHRIDVHHHILPPDYVARVGADRIGAPSASGKMPVWEPARSIETMDRNGIATALTSISSPGLAVDDPRAVPGLARRCNEYAAQLRHDYLGRFGMFATVPLPDVDAAIAEVDHAYDVLGTDGVCLLTNYQGGYLGDPSFRPLMAALDARKAVVFVHPTSPTACPACADGLSLSTLEFPFDTTRTIASLLLEGTLAHYHNIRFIFSHGGGAMPFLAGRLAMLSRNRPNIAELAPAGVIGELARLYFDTALSANRLMFQSLLELVPVDHVLLGTDFPFGRANVVDETVAGIQKLGLDANAVHRIECTNALRLLPELHPK